MKRAELRFLMIARILAPYSSSQQLDTVLHLERTASEEATIIDQVSDPKKRRSFLRLYGERTPEKRRSLAEVFSQLPQSWLMSEVFEIACKT